MSLPSGLMNYGQAVASWNQYAQNNNLSPEQTQAGLDKLAKGDGGEIISNKVKDKINEN